MDNLVLIDKTIEESKVKVIFNDTNIFLDNFLGLYINEELNLLPSIDLYTVLKIIDNSETIQQLKEDILANSWITKLRGAN